MVDKDNNNQGVSTDKLHETLRQSASEFSFLLICQKISEVLDSQTRSKENNNG